MLDEDTVATKYRKRWIHEWAAGDGCDDGADPHLKIRVHQNPGASKNPPGLSGTSIQPGRGCAASFRVRVRRARNIIRVAGTVHRRGCMSGPEDSIAGCVRVVRTADACQNGPRTRHRLVFVWITTGRRDELHSFSYPTILQVVMQVRKRSQCQVDDVLTGCKGEAPGFGIAGHDRT